MHQNLKVSDARNILMDVEMEIIDLNIILISIQIQCRDSNIQYLPNIFITLQSIWKYNGICNCDYKLEELQSVSLMTLFTCLLYYTY